MEIQAWEVFVRSAAQMHHGDTSGNAADEGRVILEAPVVRPDVTVPVVGIFLRQACKLASAALCRGSTHVTPEVCGHGCGCQG